MTRPAHGATTCPDYRVTHGDARGGADGRTWFDIRSPNSSGLHQRVALFNEQHQRFPAQLQHDPRPPRPVRRRRGPNRRRSTSPTTAGRRSNTARTPGAPSTPAAPACGRRVRRVIIEWLPDATPAAARDQGQTDHLPDHGDGLRHARGRAGRDADRRSEGVTDMATNHRLARTRCSATCASAWARSP